MALGTNDIDFRARPLSAEEAEFLAADVALTGPGDGGVTYADLERAATVVLAGLEPEDEAGDDLPAAAQGGADRHTRVLSLAPFTTRGLEKMGGTLLPTAPGDEPAALDALVEHAEHGIDATSVILVGERLATVPGALSAAATLARRTGARLAWVPRRAGDRGAVESRLPAQPAARRSSRRRRAARVDAATAWGSRAARRRRPRHRRHRRRRWPPESCGGLVVGGVDPDDTSDPVATRAAIEAARFVVALELRETEVTRAADVVFPVAPVTDKAGMFVTWEGRPRPFEQVLGNPGSLPDLRVLSGIAEELRASARAAPWASARSRRSAPGDDADLAAAVEGISVGGFFNGGQDCTAATRVLCQAGVYDEFVAELAKAAQGTRTGFDPDDEDLLYGPINNANQLSHVAGLVERAPDHARVVAGGQRVGERGYFYAPTVVADLDQSDELIQTEVFGPVITVQKFSDEDDAVAKANDSEYALASSVWSTNATTAVRMSARLDFGCVWINCHIPLQAEMPHGGYKHSGYGKDLSSYSLEEYTRIKHVMQYHGFEG